MASLHLAGAASRREEMVGVPPLAQQLQQLRLLATGLRWQKASLDPSPTLPEGINISTYNTTENGICLLHYQSKMTMNYNTLQPGHAALLYYACDMSACQEQVQPLVVLQTAKQRRAALQDDLKSC